MGDAESFMSFASLRKRRDIVIGKEIDGYTAYYREQGDYMLAHYDHPIYEDGVQLFDKVYLRMDL